MNPPSVPTTPMSSYLQMTPSSSSTMQTPSNTVKKKPARRKSLVKNISQKNIPAVPLGTPAYPSYASSALATLDEIVEQKDDDELLSNAPAGSQKVNEEGESEDDWEDVEIVGTSSVPDRDAVRPEQLQRYEAYRRAHLPRASIRKLMQTILGYSVPASVGIIVAGVAKIFIGEIVESGLDIMDDNKESVLTPQHLREAFKLYQRNHPMDSNVYTKRLF